MTLDDLVTILVDAKVGVYGTNIFQTSKAAIPSTDGPYLGITATGGSGPEGTHNATSMPGYVRPTIQIAVRGKNGIATQSMADAAFSALFKVRNKFINEVWWRQVRFLQSEPYDLGLDDFSRIILAFNIEVTKRPNAAMSQ